MIRIRYGIGWTRVGHAFVALTERGLCVLQLIEAGGAAAARKAIRHRFPKAKLVRDPRAIQAVFRSLNALLAGRSKVNIVLDLHGTPFQKRVWQALQEIPRGTTCCYSDLARRIGMPRAVRAVAGACASNPVAVFVPCHRIVRRDGGLGGYRWGIGRKRKLLQLEQGDRLRRHAGALSLIRIIN